MLPLDVFCFTTVVDSCQLRATVWAVLVGNS